MDSLSVRWATFLVHSKIFRKFAPQYHSILSHLYCLYGPYQAQKPDTQNIRSASNPSSRTRSTISIKKRRYTTSRAGKQAELFPT